MTVTISEKEYAYFQECATWMQRSNKARTSFAPGLPFPVVKTGVDVMQALRKWKTEATVSKEDMRLLEFDADQIACFLMCVQTFWERQRLVNEAEYLKENPPPPYPLAAR